MEIYVDEKIVFKFIKLYIKNQLFKYYKFD